MPCGCGKKTAVVTTANKVLVTCPTCTGPLRGEDGIDYPVHITNVIVPQYQMDIWISQGYAIVKP